MNCQETMENFPDYRNNRLELEIRAEVEAHLEECEACRLQQEAFSHVDGELERWKEIEPSPWLEQKIMARLDSDRKERERSFSFFWLHSQWATVASLLVVAGVGIWLAFPGAERPVEPSRPESHQAVSRMASAPQTATIPPTDSVGKTPQGSAATQVALVKANSEEEISQEDQALLENLDLLEDFDLINPAEGGKSAARRDLSPGTK